MRNYYDEKTGIHHGDIILTHYSGRLPAKLKKIQGDLIIQDLYPFPLPAGLAAVGRLYIFEAYAFPLPPMHIQLGGKISTFYQIPLPEGTVCSGKFEYFHVETPLPASFPGDVPVPVLEKIDAAILAAIRAAAPEDYSEALDMDTWHTCETTHCRAGWAIHLAGAAGAALEERLGPCAAGKLIYQLSRPGVPTPCFSDEDRDAMRDIEWWAARQTGADALSA